METKSASIRPDVVATITSPRPTPTPPKSHFSEVLARGIASGAAGAVSLLPGAPLVALAVRGGAAGALGSVGAIANPLSISSGLGGVEGTSPTLASIAGAAMSGAATGASGVAGDGGIASSLAQSQDTNMYFLQLQQEVDAQNRTFTTLSNVLKAESDTVKNAIGNIH